jgi:hypothetical protein
MPGGGGGGGLVGAEGAAAGASHQRGGSGGVDLPSGGKASSARARTPAEIVGRREKRRAYNSKRRLASSQLP